MAAPRKKGNENTSIFYFHGVLADNWSSCFPLVNLPTLIYFNNFGFLTPYPTLVGRWAAPASF